MQVFGDGVCTVTNNVSPGTNFYGNRFSNGRVWVEVLAERQGLPLGITNNWSYFGQSSSALITNVTHYTYQPDVGTTLFVVWANDADFVLYLNDPHFQPFTSNNIAIWTNAINQSLSNHVTAIQTLYSNGARSLLMPNAVDITKVPNYEYFAAASKSFIRQQIIAYNNAFTNRLSQLTVSLPNLAIIVPDFFALADDLTGFPTKYGFTNATSYALLDLEDKRLNGPGTNYVFWDYLDPTAKAHEILADTAQQLISPVRIGGVTPTVGSNQLSIINVPIGLNGVVEISTNLPNWNQTQSFSSTNTSQIISVPASGPMQFYRLNFPFVWSWP